MSLSIPSPGRWLLRGVAGSGKTEALVAWVGQLRREHPAWRTLYVCFNAALASALRRRLPQGGLGEATSFHEWAEALLVEAGVPIPPPPGRGTLWDRYWTRDMAALLLDTFDAGRLGAGYQAIAVDEGQDFATDWYRALIRALDPVTDRLLVAVDEAQDIYRREVPWGELGLGVGGHTLVLDANHRNARPIARAASRLIGSAEPPATAAATEGGSAGAGRRPALVRCPSFGASRAHALDWVRDRLAANVAPGDMLILGLSRLDMITVNAWLNSKGIPAVIAASGERADAVRVSTIHAAKGLDAPRVLLLDAHHLATREPVEARRLLYIAMTRAREELAVSYFRDTPLMAELRDAIDGAG